MPEDHRITLCIEEKKKNVVADDPIIIPRVIVIANTTIGYTEYLYVFLRSRNWMTPRLSFGETQIWLDSLELAEFFLGLSVRDTWWNDNVLAYLPVDRSHNALSIGLLQSIHNS